jgi:hypothetical protein
MTRDLGIVLMWAGPPVQFPGMALVDLGGVDVNSLDVIPADCRHRLT